MSTHARKRKYIFIRNVNNDTIYCISVTNTFIHNLSFYSAKAMIVSMDLPTAIVKPEAIIVPADKGHITVRTVKSCHHDDIYNMFNVDYRNDNICTDVPDKILNTKSLSKDYDTYIVIYNKAIFVDSKEVSMEIQLASKKDFSKVIRIPIETTTYKKLTESITNSDIVFPEFDFA